MTSSQTNDFINELDNLMAYHEAYTALILQIKDTETRESLQQLYDCNIEKLRGCNYQIERRMERNKRIKETASHSPRGQSTHPSNTSPHDMPDLTDDRARADSKIRTEQSHQEQPSTPPTPNMTPPSCWDAADDPQNNKEACLKDNEQTVCQSHWEDESTTQPTNHPSKQVSQPPGTPPPTLEERLLPVCKQKFIHNTEEEVTWNKRNSSGVPEYRRRTQTSSAFQK